MQIKEFISQFINDWKKIVWPSRMDVIYFFIMTLILAALFSLFFIMSDKVVSIIVNYLLGA